MTLLTPYINIIYSIAMYLNIYDKWLEQAWEQYTLKYANIFEYIIQFTLINLQFNVCYPLDYISPLVP